MQKALFTNSGTRVLAFGEDSHALRLTSELVDLQAATANLILRRFARRASFEATSAPAKTKKDTCWCPLRCIKATKKIFLRFLIRFRTQTVLCSIQMDFCFDDFLFYCLLVWERISDNSKEILSFNCVTPNRTWKRDFCCLRFKYYLQTQLIVFAF